MPSAHIAVLISKRTGGKNVELRVCSQDPEPVVLAAERLKASPFGHVPYPNSFILRVREDKLLSRMEQNGRDVVVVPTASVDFPSLGFC